MNEAHQRAIVDDPLAEKLELLNQLIVEEQLGEGVGSIPRRAAEGEDPPLSFAQQRLWFLAQLEPESAAYHMPMRLRLKGPIHLRALEQALSEIVRRHEVLRTTFSTVEGQPVQRIAPTLEVSVPVVDLRAVPEAQREDEARRFADEETLQPFSLESGPLLRASLLQLAEEDHVLLLTAHHVAFDGWSTEVFFRELARLYEDFSQDRTPSLPALPIQYADFASWQRRWLEGPDSQRQLHYWKSHLSGVDPLELPADRARPRTQSYRGAADVTVLTRECVERLQTLALGEGATLFMALMAVFQTFLHRYCGQEDVTCGFPIANRNHSDLEGLIGFFVNSLVLRTDFSGNPTFREVLQRVREATLEAHANQDLPFERLVEELQPRRDLSRNPLFQVFATMDHAAASSEFMAGLSAVPFGVPIRATRFDLEAHFVEQEGSWMVLFAYATDLFEATTIRRMLGHFVTLIEGLLANPDAGVVEVPLMTEEERQQWMAERRGPDAAYPRNQGIHLVFENQVAQTPEAIALSFKGRTLTYRELNQRANQLAWHLKGLGVGPDVLVGLGLNRSLEMVVGMLGVLKAGGAYVPLDPGYPAERLKFMVSDTRTPVILTTAELQSGFPAEGIQRLCLDAAWPALEREGGDNPPNPVDGDHLAYVMYTSGSTGLPKGVAVPHRGVLRLLLGVEYVALGSDKTFLSHSPVSFDASTFEIWGPLLHGGRCVLSPEPVSSVADLGRLIRAEGVNVLWLTSALFNCVIDEDPEILSPVGQLLVGGEALSVPHVHRALQCLPTTQLINGYGPTESTTFTCCYAIPKDLPADGRSIALGRPIANTQAYVLDRGLNPVVAGVVGELYIGGDGLARSYWNRPELTAERFVPHPCKPGAWLYRSGDLVRLRTDGNLEFVGRNDQQVKVRGFRIELGEIEAVLGRCAEVKACVVAAWANESGSKQLVGYVVAAAGRRPGAGELKRHLAESLPDYMVPGVFVMMDALPLTPNGKVDRRALPNPEQDGHAADVAAPPRDELELQLVHVWEQVLGRAPVGIGDNFFELGGHSLLAVKLFSRIEKVTGTHLPLATLFENPTIERLAAVMRQGGWKRSWDCLVPIQAGGSRPPLFCVHGAGGNVFFLRDLARRLGDDQPFYGIQARGLKAGDTPHERVEDMAEDYLREIRKLQPQGPYYLAGFCMGGMVAFEMARRLHRDGQDVGLLALMEAHGPGYFISPRNQVRFFYEDRTWWQRLRHNVRQLRLATPPERRLLIWRKFAQLRSRLLAPAIRWLARVLVWCGHPTLAALKRVHHANIRAQMHYMPQDVYPGGVDLFRAEKQPVGHYQYDPHYGWGACAAGGVTVHEFPGYHGTLFQEPYVSVLIEKLKHRLQKAQSVAKTGS